MSARKFPSVSVGVCYRDPKAALTWLEEAFGFEPAMVILAPDGSLAHSEMRFGDGVVMVGSEWSDAHKSPASIGGKNTQSTHIQLETDIDAHCEHARKSGAVIAQEPETQFYGDRTYRAVDPEGHIWTFGQTVEAVPPEDWEKTTGMTMKTRL